MVVPARIKAKRRESHKTTEKQEGHPTDGLDRFYQSDSVCCDLSRNVFSTLTGFEMVTQLGDCCYSEFLNDSI